MGNGKLLSQLNVYSEKKHYFPTPAYNQKKVYIFPDVPHCLKNMRYHSLNYNLVIKVKLIFFWLVEL